MNLLWKSFQEKQLTETTGNKGRFRSKKHVATKEISQCNTTHNKRQHALRYNSRPMAQQKTTRNILNNASFQKEGRKLKFSWQNFSVTKFFLCEFSMFSFFSCLF